MTVKNLISELAKMPQEMDVFIPDSNHDARLTPEFCKRLLEMKRGNVRKEVKE